MNEETLFHLALEKPPHERAAFLEATCAGDADLRERVQVLLQANESAGSFLQKPIDEVMATSAFQADATPDSQPATHQIGESGAGTPVAGNSDHTQADSAATREIDALAFLSPSAQPGNLGRLGHYEIHEVIGKGGFGTVLKALDEKLHRVVAIKVLSPAYAAIGSARKRFIREAQTAAAVKNEHVVAIHGVEDEAQPPYLVMEIIDGISLQDKLDKKGPLSLKEILRIGSQTAEGLAAAHKQGLVHRDIKPANILLENGVERVKITDFGLARAVDDASITQSGTVAGTPMYMSPEQAEGLPIDHRSDLFSLGTVLYAMCTGHPPFRASGTHAVLKRVIDASPRPIREINNEIPDWLCAIISRLHAKKAEDRFQTAKEVAELLGQHLAHVQQPDTAPRPAAVSVPPRVETSRTGRSRIVRVAAVLALVAIVAATVLASPFLYRYAMNQSTLIFSGTMDPNLDKILVKQKGETVAELTTLEGMVHLPAGDYELEVVCKKGYELTKFRVGSAGSSGSSGWHQAKGPSFPVRLAGADHVSIGVELEKAPAGPTNNPPEPGWVQLFNGKDLVGWKTPPEHQGNWSVKDGVLKGEDAGSLLFWKERQYDNFHLLVEGRISEGGDSGVFFRVPFQHANFETGYEAHISTDSVAGWRTGSLLLFSKGQTRPGGRPSSRPDVFAKANEWFTLEVIAKDEAVSLKLDGKTVNEHRELSGAARTGYIALQQTAGKMTIEFRKIAIKELPREGPYQLAFNGRESLVKIESPKNVNSAALTVEAWTTVTGPGTYSVGDWPLTGHLYRNGIRTFGALAMQAQKLNDGTFRWTLSAISPQNDLTTVTSTEPIQFHRLTHVAGVFDGKELALYIDGRKQGQGAVVKTPWPMLLVPCRIAGDEIDQPSYVGRVHQLRISKVARYLADFQPAADLPSDPQTVALYRCDEGSGEKLTDSSGNGLHGKIIGGAKWVKVDVPPIGFTPLAGLAFDGKSSYVDIPSLERNTVGPATLEAWVLTDAKPMTLLMRVNGKAPFQIYFSKGGLMGHEWVPETMYHRPVFSAEPLNPQRWTHVAYVIDDLEARVFVDGLFKKRVTGKLPMSFDPAEHRGAWIGAEYQVNGYWFKGTVAGIRVSTSARYDKNFTPEKHFTLDHDTLALYHCNEGAGDKLTDSSGNAHHGKIVGAKWVRTEPASNSETGWVQLFNEKDLTGWNVSEPDKWAVKDGVITGRGGSSFLTCNKFLRNFHARIQAKVVTPGLAHVNFRNDLKVSPVVMQAVLSASRAGVGTLGIYEHPKPGRTLVWSEKYPQDWFTIEVIAVGKQITIKVDGETTVDRAVSEMPDEGKFQLSLIDKEAEIHFRKIEIKELPAEEPGWAPLFNGKDFDGWIAQTRDKDLDPKTPWAVADGVLIAKGGNAGVSSLRTVKPYDNFTLKLKFRMPRRAPGDTPYNGDTGVVLQRQEADVIFPATGISFNLGRAWDGKALNVHQVPLKSATLVHQEPAVYKTASEWNDLELTSKDGTIEALINGKLTIRLAECQLRKGYIVLIAQGVPIDYRDIVIKELPAP